MKKVKCGICFRETSFRSVILKEIDKKVISVCQECQKKINKNKPKAYLVFTPQRLNKGKRTYRANKIKLIK